MKGKPRFNDPPTVRWKDLPPGDNVYLADEREGTFFGPYLKATAQKRLVDSGSSPDRLVDQPSYYDYVDRPGEV